MINLKAALISNPGQEGSKLCIKNIINELVNLNIEILMFIEDKNRFDFKNIKFYDDFNNLICECDVVITIGGDGTIIHASKYACKYNKPILGINLGRIGFVSGLEANEIHYLKKLVDGDYKIEQRSMLFINIENKNEEFLALNDVVISRGCLSSIVDLCVSLNGHKMNEYRADGLIIATPTGSTAYSLSAGGPIIDPKMECILLTPVCPHSISSRPIILDKNQKISVEISLRDENDAVMLIDGRDPIKIEKDFKINIRVSERKVKLIKINDDDFYKVLRKKLSNR